LKPVPSSLERFAVHAENASGLTFVVATTSHGFGNGRTLDGFELAAQASREGKQFYGDVLELRGVSRLSHVVGHPGQGVWIFVLSAHA